jgi:hypothetical protein
LLVTVDGFFFNRRALIVTLAAPLNTIPPHKSGKARIA